MQYRIIGQTGLSVSTICLGTVYLGSQISPDESIRIVRRALDSGVSFVDTAEIYTRPSYGVAEEVVGQALAGRRHEVILATKKRYDPRQFRTGGPGDHGLSRRQIVSGIEGSLRRLRTDYIDLYYPHHPDPEVPLEETLWAFDDLTHAGKVRYLGLSNYPPWQVVQSLWIADHQRLTPPSCAQALYNLLDRSVEREMVPVCQEHDLGLVAYSPLAGGVLTAKYGDGTELPPESRAARVGPVRRGRPGHIPVLSEQNLAVARRLDALARQQGETAASLAIAWTLHQPRVTSVIMGASTIAQLEANLSAADLTLSAETVRAIEKLTVR